MPAYCKILLIFILVAAFMFENEAHHCGCRHKKIHKKCEKETTHTTPSTKNKCDPRACHDGNKFFCNCGIDGDYPLPESGNCDDVIKNNTRLHSIPTSTTPEYYSNNKCSKYRTLCTVRCYCEDEYMTPALTPTKLCYPEACDNATEYFCRCDGLHGVGLAYFRVPKSGNCDDVPTPTYSTSSWVYQFGFSCIKTRTVCKLNCDCLNEKVDEHMIITPTPTPTQSQHGRQM